jgi:hypothetical protein
MKRDPRTDILVSRAVVFTIEALARLPFLEQPWSDLRDLRQLLDDEHPTNLEADQKQARRWLDRLIELGSSR